ncbi:hypothetical protein ABC977_02320 [Thioalkalicoccus limnaeus]|uniref:Uncharacterized protein n=1 Tax=Thioalkalicoccus limnaeus TaxID=120681 RepID=A0ABV4BA06_9GAMM
MNHIPQNDEQKATDLTRKLIERIQEESKIWVGEGRDAWTALSRLGGAALASGDAEIIATQLAAEFPAFRARIKQQGKSLGDFCLKAGLGQHGQYSKELHRMLLPPGKRAQDVGLRRAASKYQRLIRAMASVTNESTSALANRLLAGTTLHPANAAIREDVDRVYLMLQHAVDSVDAEFGLFATFQETARLKAQHAAEDGECRWPQWEASFRTSTAHFLRIELGLIGEDDPDAHAQAIQEKLAKVAQERQAAMDVTRAYWERPVSRLEKEFDSWRVITETGCTAPGCLQDDEFFYVPHSHLGYCPDLDTSTDESAATREIWLPKLREKTLSEYAQYGSDIIDGWNEEKLCPEGQTTSLPHTFGQWHAWIVIYPAPDNSRLMPMFYIPGEEGGAILVPLDPITLKALRRIVWVSPQGEVLSFYERIKSLIGFRPGEQQVLLDSFRRTAPWLKHNPIKKLIRRQAQEREWMEAYYSRAILPARTPAKHAATGAKLPETNPQDDREDDE